VSPHAASPLKGRNHERARDLAALRLDEALGAADAVWLEGHLAACQDCSGVAAGYADTRLAFQGLRANPAEPPRDLWARTAAKIEFEASRRPNRAPAPRRAFGGRVPMGALAPLTAVIVAAVAIGAGLFNGTSLVPSGTAALPTPIAITAAADVQVLSRGEDGTVQIVSRPVNAVCPPGSSECGLTRTFAVTNVGGVTASDGSLNAAMSPRRDNLVVVASRNGSQGVYVLPVAAPKPSPSATRTPAPSVDSSASLIPASPVVVATGTPVIASASASADASPDASSSPEASPSIAVSPAPNGVLEIASNVVVVGSAAYSPDGMQVAFSARPADGSTGPDVYLWTSGEAVARGLTSDHAAQFASWTTAGILVSRVSDGTPATSLLVPATGVETPVDIGAAWLPVVDPTGTMGAWWSGTVKLDDTGAWVPDRGELVVGPWPKNAGAGAVSASPDPSSTPDASDASSASSSTAASSTPVVSNAASPSASGAVSSVPADPSVPAVSPTASPSVTPSSSASPASSSAQPDPSLIASPSVAPDGAQVLAHGPLLAWAVRWDEAGTAMAVWTLGAGEPAVSPSPAETSGTQPAGSSASEPAGSSTAPDGTGSSPGATLVPVAPDGKPTSVDATQIAPHVSVPAAVLPAETAATGTPAATPAGRLSLYRVDAATGVAILAHPMLDAAPADGGFSLRTGRLAWTSRATGELVLQVLAWSGTTIGRLELPAVSGAMIVP
jgi:hypothetical protein